MCIITVHWYRHDAFHIYEDCFTDFVSVILICTLKAHAEWHTDRVRLSIIRLDNCLEDCCCCYKLTYYQFSIDVGLPGFQCSYRCPMTNPRNKCSQSIYCPGASAWSWIYMELIILKKYQCSCIYTLYYQILLKSHFDMDSEYRYHKIYVKRIHAQNGNLRYDLNQ